VQTKLRESYGNQDGQTKFFTVKQTFHRTSYDRVRETTTRAPQELEKLKSFDPITQEQNRLSPTIIQNTPREKMKSGKIEHRQLTPTGVLWLIDRKVCGGNRARMSRRKTELTGRNWADWA
jgi:hypothetical protein